MTPRAWIVAVVALVLALVCVRLGVWQLSRWQGKRHANAELHASLAAPPLAVRDAATAAALAPGRRVRVEGAFDHARTVLLSDQWRKEQPGVEVVAPYRLAGGGELLVDRGWLPSTDGVAAGPQQHADTVARAVTGLLERVPPTRTRSHPDAWLRLPGGPTEIWSVRALDADSLRAHFPGALPGLVLRALPDPAAPALPSPAEPEPADAGLHLSYAVQWFLFAAAMLAGAVFVAGRERERVRTARTGP